MGAQVIAFLAYVGVMTLASLAIMPYTGASLPQALIMGPAVGVVVYIIHRVMDR